MELTERFECKWELGSKIEAGAFGEVYHGRSIETNMQVAIKFEISNAGINQLKNECEILKELTPSLGFPKFLWSGTFAGYIILVEELLGKSLEKLTKSLSNLSVKSVLIIADQLLARLQVLHSHHLLHRDLKPGNILFGTGNHTSTLYLIDFGLAKVFKTKKSGHIPFAVSKEFVGNYYYASIAAMKGHEQGRKDDLESLGYILIDLLVGSMPWQDLKNSKCTFEAVLKAKQNLSTERFCQGCPSVMLDYMNYIKKLEFSQKPDYFYLRKLFRDYMFKNNLSYKAEFEWNKPRIEAINYQLKLNRIAEDFRDGIVTIVITPQDLYNKFKGVISLN